MMKISNILKKRLNNIFFIYKEILFKKRKNLIMNLFNKKIK